MAPIQHFTSRAVDRPSLRSTAGHAWLAYGIGIKHAYSSCSLEPASSSTDTERCLQASSIWAAPRIENVLKHTQRRSQHAKRLQNPRPSSAGRKPAAAVRQRLQARPCGRLGVALIGQRRRVGRQRREVPLLRRRSKVLQLLEQRCRLLQQRQGPAQCMELLMLAVRTRRAVQKPPKWSSLRLLDGAVNSGAS